MQEEIMKSVSAARRSVRRYWTWLGALALAWGNIATAAEAPKEVRIAAVSYANGVKTGFHGSAGIVEKEGWLRNELQKRGIRLVWVPVAAQSVGATVNEAFANKSIDFAAYGDLPSIILNAGGVETRLIVPGGRGNNVYLLVPPGSTAKSVADLKGKRIALHRGRPWEITFARLAEANGLKLSDFKIANLNPGAGAAALASGNVDAFVTLSDAYSLVDKKVGRILWSTKVPGQDWKMRAELWADKGYLEKHPDIAQIVSTAFVKAAYWSAQDANFDEFIKIAVAAGQSESVARREYAQDTVNWKSRWNPQFDDFVTEHYRNAVSYSRKINLIRRDVDVQKLFEPRFVRQALKDLGIEQYWQAPVVAGSSKKGA
jgi:sulfonate transport system substrate-binding protein